MAEARATLGTRRAEAVMGTVFNLDVRDEIDSATVAAFFAELRRADARFSTYRPSSEISRLDRGTLQPGQASADVRQVLEHCEQLRRDTRGFFNVRAAGRLDPSAYVKGWAAERAASALDSVGARNYSINAGGDVLVRGTADGKRWRVGIQHPIQTNAVAAVLEANQLAVATSGTYQRGHHIIDPLRDRPVDSLLSLTVIGPSLATADAYATAAFAMGPEGLAWIATRPGYGGMAVGLDRVMRSTPGFDAHRV